MIFPRPYRRTALEHEGCAPEFVTAPALACHKGDAVQEQSNEQTGAQTGGIAGVTINQTVAAPAASGRRGPGGNPTPPAPGATAGSAQAVTIDTNDPTQLQAALDAVTTSTQDSTQALQQIAQSVVDNSSSTNSLLKEMGAYVLAIVCAFLGFKIFTHRKA